MKRIFCENTFKKKFLFENAYQANYISLDMSERYGISLTPCFCSSCQGYHLIKDDEKGTDNNITWPIADERLPGPKIISRLNSLDLKEILLKRKAKNVPSNVQELIEVRIQKYEGDVLSDKISNRLEKLIKNVDSLEDLYSGMELYKKYEGYMNPSDRERTHKLLVKRINKCIKDDKTA